MARAKFPPFSTAIHQLAPLGSLYPDSGVVISTLRAGAGHRSGDLCNEQPHCERLRASGRASGSSELMGALCSAAAYPRRGGPRGRQRYAARRIERAPKGRSISHCSRNTLVALVWRLDVAFLRDRCAPLPSDIDDDVASHCVVLLFLRLSRKEESV